MTNEEFKAWRKMMRFTMAEAAEELGLSVGTIVLYEAGKRRDNGKSVEIPRHVELACIAIEHGLHKGLVKGDFEVKAFFQKLQRRAIGFRGPNQHSLDESNEVDRALKELRLVQWGGAISADSGISVEATNVYGLSKRGEKFVKCSETDFIKAIEPALNSQTATHGSYSRAIINDIDNVLLALGI